MMRSPARTSRGQHLGPLDDTDREADEVELARLHHAGVLRHLAAEQRAAGLAAALGDAARRSRRSPRARACRPRCSRGRTAARRPAPRCRRPTSRRSRCRSCRSGPASRAIDRLRADAVGRRHEQRVAVALPVDGEQPAEPADVADDLGPERRADVRLDELDGLLAGRDVDARVGVGQRPLVGAGLIGDQVTRARRASTRELAQVERRASSSELGVVRRAPAPGTRR